MSSAIADDLRGWLKEPFFSQEHGVVASKTPLPFERLHVGTQLRVTPNHVCMTAAMYDRYHVVDGGDEVVAVWDRINGW